MESLFQSGGLNEEQKTAVASNASVLQILAPPGSGKTKTLTGRVGWLISYGGLKAMNIVVCTFTIKAAREMKERIMGLLGKEAVENILLGTFHSVARRLLLMYVSGRGWPRRQGMSRKDVALRSKQLGLPGDFGVADSTDSTDILKRVIKQLKSETADHQFKCDLTTLDVQALRNKISRAKAFGQNIEFFQRQNQQYNDYSQKMFTRIYEEYERGLAMANLLDYDDLLLRCVDLLTHFPECVEWVEAVLIDEFQDTNLTQYRLMQLLAQKRQNITVVGDPDQSIYSFRFVDTDNLHRIETDYDCTTLNLQRNYRSSPGILRLAVRIIEQDFKRKQRPITPHHEFGPTPVLRALPNPTIEARWITGEIKRLCRLSGGLICYDDIAILLRTSSGSREIESYMGKRGIAYIMIGGHKFFDRIEVRLLIDYLRVIQNPNHTDAVLRILNVPSRGIGATTISKLLKCVEERKVSLWTVILSIIRKEYQNIPTLVQLDQKLGEIKDGELKHALKQRIYGVHLQTCYQRDCNLLLSNRIMEGLREFVSIIIQGRIELLSESATSSIVNELLKYIIGAVNLRQYIAKYLVKKAAEENAHPESDVDHQVDSRWCNVEEVLRQSEQTYVVHEIEQVANLSALKVGVTEVGSEAGESYGQVVLREFLANIALSSSSIENSDHQADKMCEHIRGKVTISTIHAAKGLEWPIVFIADVVNGNIPHSRAKNIDEERRLLYVGVTRAKALLYLISTENDYWERANVCALEDTSYQLMQSNWEEIEGKATLGSRRLSEFLSFIGRKSLVKRRGPSLDETLLGQLAQLLNRTEPRRDSIKQCHENWNQLYHKMTREKVNEIQDNVYEDEGRKDDDYWPINGEFPKLEVKDSHLLASKSIIEPKTTVKHLKKVKEQSNFLTSRSTTNSCSVQYERAIIGQQSEKNLAGSNLTKRDYMKFDTQAYLTGEYAKLVPEFGKRARVDSTKPKCKSEVNLVTKAISQEVFTETKSWCRGTDFVTAGSHFNLMKNKLTLTSEVLDKVSMTEDKSTTYLRSVMGREGEKGRGNNTKAGFVKTSSLLQDGEIYEDGTSKLVNISKMSVNKKGKCERGQVTLNGYFQKRYDK